MPEIIYNYLPLKYLDSLISSGLHFSPCSSFVDKLEFRAGFAWAQGQVESYDQIDDLLPELFSNERVNELMKCTYISCWTKDPVERYAMWELYGKRNPSIRISVRVDNLEYTLRRCGVRGATGTVTYGFRRNPHQIAPDSISTFGDIDAFEDEFIHAFFHKHDFYRFEQEFRVVSIQQRPSVPIIGEIKDAVLSPFVEWSDPEIESISRKLRRDVSRSALFTSYKT